MSQEAYYTADMLDVELVAIKDQLSGFDEKIVAIGPFRVRVKVTVISDMIRAGEVSTFVSVGGKLWLYTVVSPSRSVVYVVDGKKAGLNLDTVHTYGGVSWMTTVRRFIELASIIGVYQWDGCRYNKVESPKKES